LIVAHCNSTANNAPTFRRLALDFLDDNTRNQLHIYSLDDETR
jgi:hypothetical protein